MKINVHSRPAAFRRAGILFHSTGTVIETDELSVSSLKAIANESQLVADADIHTVIAVREEAEKKASEASETKEVKKAK